MTREYSRLALRLAVAAHRAVGNNPFVLENSERGIKRVKRTAAGRQNIQRLWIERETGPAVLHNNACCRQHASGAELPIERLDI